MSLFNMNTSMSASMASSLNNLNSVNRLASDSLKRLETGQKFNHAADDPSSVVKAGDLSANMTANESAINRNNGYLGDLDMVMQGQDEVLSVLNDMKDTLQELMTATDGQAAIAEKYNQYADSIDSIIGDVSFNGTQVLGTGSAVTETVNVNAGGGVSGSSGGTFDLVFDDITRTTLSLDNALGTTASAANTELTALDAAIDDVMTASAKTGAGYQVIESNNNIMSSALTGWSQSFNSLVGVNDAAESALLSSLQNRQSAIQASMGYQAQFAAGMSSISFMA